MLTAYGSEYVSKELESFEGDPHRVAELFFAAHGFWPETVEEEEDGGRAWELMGCCEGCSRPIFDGEPYQTWEDGIITHKGACPKVSPSLAEIGPQEGTGEATRPEPCPETP